MMGIKKEDLSPEAQNLINMVEAMQKGSLAVMTPKSAAMRMAMLHALLSGDLVEYSRNAAQVWGVTLSGKQIVMRIDKAFGDLQEGKVGTLVRSLLAGTEGKDDFEKVLEYLNQKAPAKLIETGIH